MHVSLYWEWETRHFHDKRRRARFRDVKRNERRVHFRDKMRLILSNASIIYFHNQRRALGTCVSLLLEKRARLRY
jgi:tRNA(Met) C34 N-acetyltransferase TmcA